MSSDDWETRSRVPTTNFECSEEMAAPVVASRRDQRQRDCPVLDLDWKTVQKYLKLVPREYERKPKSWKVDPFRAHLRESWELGVLPKNSRACTMEFRSVSASCRRETPHTASATNKASARSRTAACLLSCRGGPSPSAPVRTARSRSGRMPAPGPRSVKARPPSSPVSRRRGSRACGSPRVILPTIRDRINCRQAAMAYSRADLRRADTLSAADLCGIRDGTYISSAGSVIARQRPGTAKDFIVFSMEDGTGIANVIVTPDLFERQPCVEYSGEAAHLQPALLRGGCRGTTLGKVAPMRSLTKALYLTCSSSRVPK
jgi:hypothetical protein